MTRKEEFRAATTTSLCSRF